MHFNNWSTNQVLLFNYIFSTAVCLIVFISLIFKTIKQNNPKKIDYIFRQVLIAHFIYFFLEIIWAFIHFEQFKALNFLLKFIRSLKYSTVSLATFGWFLYIVEYVHSSFSFTKKRIWVSSIPCFINMVISFALCFSVYDGEICMSFLLTLIPFLYMIFASTYAIFKILNNKEIIDKKGKIFFAAYPLSLILFAVLQIIFEDIPVLCFGTSAIVLVIFIYGLSNKISTDTLTGLNNRNELNRYVYNNIKSNNCVYVVMFDVDDFKLINDFKGHVEGDRALLQVSNILKTSLSNKGGFLARYGGDEFIMILKDCSEEDIKEIFDIIDKEVNKINENNNNYNLGISRGYAKMKDDEDFISLINRADLKLYEMKKNKNVGR